MTTRLDFGSEGCMVVTPHGGFYIESASNDSEPAIVALLIEFLNAKNAAEIERQKPVIAKFRQWLMRARRIWRRDTASERAKVKRARNRSLVAAAHRIDYH